MPALAVAEALRRRGAEVSFIGVAGRSSTGLVERYGFPEDAIAIQGLQRKLSLKNVRALALAALAVPKAIRLIRRRRADVVIAAGGYVGGPVAIAARLTRRPLMLTEADSHLGLANRLAAPLAKRIALAYPLAGRIGRRYVVTGRPVSDAVRSATREVGRAAFNLSQDATVVLIAGGSQGARTLNTAAVGAFGDGPPFELLHVAGPAQVDGVREELATHTPGPRYHLIGYLENFHDALAAADLVVSRSGGSVFEIAAVGRASILVPYPYATADHQAKNAEWLEEAGAAWVLPDTECTSARLRELVSALLADRHQVEVMADEARRVGRPDAADEIAELALGIARS
jgi:UDP-N-acetylglucosamine--N-acetylmuramyl-(pentapeptide) pyrophosphoryl-undecaprenol N-acetylglucosamine transferase